MSKLSADERAEHGSSRERGGEDGEDAGAIRGVGDLRGEDLDDYPGWVEADCKCMMKSAGVVLDIVLVFVGHSQAALQKTSCQTPPLKPVTPAAAKHTAHP